MDCVARFVCFSFCHEFESWLTLVSRRFVFLFNHQKPWKETTRQFLFYCTKHLRLAGLWIKLFWLCIATLLIKKPCVKMKFCHFQPFFISLISLPFPILQNQSPFGIPAELKTSVEYAAVGCSAHFRQGFDPHMKRKNIATAKTSIP